MKINNEYSFEGDDGLIHYVDEYGPNKMLVLPVYDFIRWMCSSHSNKDKFLNKVKWLLDRRIGQTKDRIEYIRNEKNELEKELEVINEYLQGLTK